MKITNVEINNFRNLTNVKLPLNKLTSIIGSNNSGKSNFLRAITLPLLTDEIGSGGKKLTWTDIGEKSKRQYYKFIESNRSNFVNEKVPLASFKEIIPEITVTLDFEVDEELYYFMKNFLVDVDNNIYQLQYKFYCPNSEELLKHIVSVLNTFKGENLAEIKQNLLPIDYFKYSIIIPEKEESVSFETLKSLTYNTIAAERDDFSSNNLKLGSKSLINLLNNNLTNDDKVQIEQQYENFFEEIKALTNMDSILNWQETSHLTNAREFFDKISVLPNMPPMTSLLNSVQLGYDDIPFTTQGLGYRNLILQVVMINSLITTSESIYSLLTIEEPEAHLSYKNQILMFSYLQNSLRKNENTQIVYSSHSTQFINKLDLKDVIVFNDGKGYSLSEELGEESLNYLTKNPNLDIFKIFFSPKCILVEGLTEEILIKNYLNNRKNQLHSIDVLSFHKGFIKIMDLWLKLNKSSSSKLGVVRDFDNQPDSRRKHEQYNGQNIKVETTSRYTLEDDIVNQDDNYSILKNYFEDKYNWNEINTKEQLIKKWKESKAEVMLRFCQDAGADKLKGIALPNHIKSIIEWIEVENDEN